MLTAIQPLCLTFRSILGSQWIAVLDSHIAIWPWKSLAASTQHTYRWGLVHYLMLMGQLWMSAWPSTAIDLEQNVVRFVVHLVTECGLRPATVQPYLAGVRMAQLVRRGTLAPFRSDWMSALLAATERLDTCPLTWKRPITTPLLVLFTNLLPTAPPEICCGWAPIVTGVWLMLRLGKWTHQEQTMTGSTVFP